MTLIVNRFNPMTRHSRNGIFFFRNREEAEAFVNRYGLAKDSIVHGPNGYIVKRPVK